MNAKTAESLLPCYRSGKPNESQVERAGKFAATHDALRGTLDAQARFDARVSEVVRAIAPPDDLAARLAARGASPVVPGAKSPRPPLALPAILAVVIGGLVIVAWLAYLEMERAKRFPGRDAVEQMVRRTSELSAFDLDHVSHAAGQLGDWFYMRGFEDYALPAELATLTAAGSRVFRQDGKPVAQVAIAQPESLISVFRASDFNVQIRPDGAWQFLEHEGWAAALRRRGETCVLVTLRGTEKEMRAFLSSLPRSSAP